MKPKHLIVSIVGLFYLNTWSMEPELNEPIPAEEDMPRGVNWGLEEYFEAPKETKSMTKGSRIWKNKNDIINEKNTRIRDFNNAINKSGNIWNGDNELARCVKDIYRNYRNITVNIKSTNNSPPETMGMEEIYDIVNNQNLCHSDIDQITSREKDLCYHLSLQSFQAQESILDCWDEHLKRKKNKNIKKEAPTQKPQCPKELKLRQLENLSKGAYLPVNNGYLWANDSEKNKIINRILEVRSAFGFISMTTATLLPLEQYCTYRYKGSYNESAIFIKIDLIDSDSNQIIESEEAQNPIPFEMNRRSKEQGEKKEDSESLVSTLSSSSIERK